MKITLWVLLGLVGAGILASFIYFSTVQFNGPRHRAASEEDTSTTTPIHNPEAAAGKEVYHLDVDGARREFIVYRPDNVPLTQKLPVVFMFHGGNQNGEIFYENSGWVQKADAEGIVTVFPTAMKYHTYAEEKVKHGVVEEDVYEHGTRWAAPKLADTFDPNYPDQTIYNDEEFIQAMKDFLDDNYAVDDNRFYASGFSNGAGFVNSLMVSMTDTFAAFASNSSGGLSLETMQAEGDYKPSGFEPRPAVVFIGSEDAKLLNGISDVTGLELSEFPTDESAADVGSPVRERYIDPYLDIMELNDTYTYERSGRLSHFTFDDPRAGSDAQYNFYIADGMKHVYPNGDNFPVTAVDIYWPFFAEYSL